MVGQAIATLFGSFFVLLLAGVPISAGIGIASILTAWMAGMPADIFALTAAQRCFSGLDSFSLLALPFFSLGGNIMNKGGIAKRLVRLARLLATWLPPTCWPTCSSAQCPAPPWQPPPPWAPSSAPWRRTRAMIPTTPPPSTSAPLPPAS